MRNSYIANSAEALNLHNGTQTAIVVAMKVQPKNTEQTLCTITEGNGSESGKHFWCNVVDFSCTNQTETFNVPYEIGQEVYVREAWGEYPNAIYTVYFADYPKGATTYFYPNGNFEPVLCDLPKKRSSATMPKSAARTRFNIVSCEAVRVKDITEKQANQLACERLHEDDLGQTFKSHKRGFERDAISRFGQSAWDNNDYIWFYKIEKI
jgi:hypothetical protein